MTLGNRESQLELFDVQRQSAPPPRETVGRLLIQLRYDQCVLAGMAGLIGLAMIFAGGVERGKQLVRSERVLLARQPQPASPSTSQTSAAPSTPQSLSEESSPASSETTTKLKSAPAPSAAPKLKTPKRVVSDQPAKSPTVKAGASRYAVQVVTFKRSDAAKRELDRLQALGERAFLVMREGRTMVYVGPFPSKTNASEKLVDLKPRYQDCFVRTL